MPRLRLPREEVERVLRQRLRAGEELGAKAGTAERTGGHRDWLHLFTKWRDDTIAELSAAYDETDMAAEFSVVTSTSERSSPRAAFEPSKEAHDLGIYTLKMMIERLPLAEGDLEPLGTDTLPRALAGLPDRNQLSSDIVTSLVDRQPVALAFVDLDNFKSVNDTKGHQAGDECLEEVVRIIGRAVAFKGRMYRYGHGDEFCVLLYNSTISEAVSTAERIRQEIEDAKPGGDDIDVTASIGVAVSTQKGLDDPRALIRAADDTLYLSKHGGKNMVSTWRENTQTAD
jgi:diguanylate cyclase (GGDEF)-like protein